MLLYFVLSMHTEQHTHTLYVPLTSICKPHPQKAHLSLLTLSANFFSLYGKGNIYRLKAPSCSLTHTHTHTLLWYEVTCDISCYQQRKTWIARAYFEDLTVNSSRQ